MLRLANDVLGVHARLTVVPATGWRRDMYYDATGLPWVRPSPALPDLESALHYPGTCLFEGTNLSVGRGTALAYQVIGAPWLDAAAVIRRTRDGGGGTGDGLDGVAVTADTSTPRGRTDGQHGGLRVNSLLLRSPDRTGYRRTR